MPGRGDDHRRALDLVELLRLLAARAVVHPLVVEDAAAAEAVQADAVRVGVLRRRCASPPSPSGCPGGWGRDAGALGHQRVHQDDHLLRAPHRERGDDHDAAARERARAAPPAADRRPAPPRACGCRTCSPPRGSRPARASSGSLASTVSKRPTSPLKSTRVCRPPSLTARSTEAAPSRWPASRKRKENTGEILRSSRRGTVSNSFRHSSTSAST